MATGQPSSIPLATVTDLESSWKALTADEEARAEVLILQASNYLRQVAFNNGQNIDDNIDGDPSGVYGELVKMVVTASVQRIIASPADIVPDATQWSQSASPYSESINFGSNISSTLYFKDKELKLLGLGSVSGRPGVSILRGAR